MNTFLSRVCDLQTELKAPKGQYNSFGKYKYRSCEDILEAVKPLLHKHRLVLTVSDTLTSVGDRFYVQATARLRDTESECFIENTALAREAAEKKGMDESQITGTASSYARKYALNGLFCIDDTKDADTDAFTAKARGEELPPDAAFPKPKTEDPAPVKVTPCADCGAVLHTIFKKDGSPWEPENIAAYSMRRFNRVLCPDCQKKALKNES